MTKRTDIIDGSKALGRKYGLIYTKKCGWVDLGHANPEGAKALWDKISTEASDGQASTGYFRISYRQMMGRKNVVMVGVVKNYEIKKGLSLDQKRSVALSIFMDVSHSFEGMQSNWLFRLATNSGYSAEDLVSNLIGFYRAVFPSQQFISLCQPVSLDQALNVWDTYGAVGDNKNYTSVPYIYPLSGVKGGPMSAPLPKELDSIKLAKKGEWYKEVKVW